MDGVTADDVVVEDDVVAACWRMELRRPTIKVPPTDNFTVDVPVSKRAVAWPGWGSTPAARWG